jgi:hypothetical protein
MSFASTSHHFESPNRKKTLNRQTAVFFSGKLLFESIRKGWVHKQIPDDGLDPSNQCYCISKLFSYFQFTSLSVKFQCVEAAGILIFASSPQSALHGRSEIFNDIVLLHIRIKFIAA